MRSTVEGFLEQLAASASSERDKGDRFERLVRAFLTVDTGWAARFSEVFLWAEWPGRDGRPDRGIDLVAVERETGMPVAVQCKFYAADHYVTKPDVDSFLSESGKHPFVGRLIVATTDRWNSAAEAAIKGQQIPVQRIGLTDLIDSSIDWSQFTFATPERLTTRPRKQLRPHQAKALSAVRAGFASGDRGKLIMACGTGKTLTSLRIAEDLVGAGGTVLFLVPSIALLSQSLKEWSLEAVVPLRTFAVCSDAKVGKDRGSLGEDISVVDLEIPATTDPARLVAQVERRHRASDGDRDAAMTVVFSTYQSIDVIRQAQGAGVGRFDLIVCDEAHRTTGATLAGGDESAFVRVHDEAYIGGAKRLYMTATPRIYDDASKAKAGQADAVLASMDDEALYGPEFHRLDFGEAVGLGLLSDYRVLILTVPEAAVSRVMQTAFAVDSELNLPDAAKIIGCWNGLSKRGDTTQDFPTDPLPMRRAVAFCRSIRTSQVFEREFAGVVDHYADVLDADSMTVDDDGTVRLPDRDLLQTEVHHVDGTMNILARNAALDWLRSEPSEGHCRILTNARCLAEGVDVPALDAVIFLNPRKSEVDVVQAVGRVMRQAPGKKYGYIILPIAIPAGEQPDVALRNNERYSVIWKVLQALRAHDSRFNAMINQIELNHASPDQIRVIGVDVPGEDASEVGSGTNAAGAVQAMLPLDWEQWRDAIYAKIVNKVGSRRYWEDWAKDVASIVAAHTARLTVLVEQGDARVREAFGVFLAGLRANLNDSIDVAQAIGMLSQHMITRPVFDALFEDYSFSTHNPVAQVMQRMLDALEGANLDAETASLDKFYESVRVRVQGIDNAAGKQRVLMELYEKFFRLAFKKTAQSLGIVYTPVEIVDFIIRAVDDLLREHFGMSLSDQGVHVLDPFTGTGTFIVRLLESGLIRPEELARKYATELHANEILLLAYYIAAANIEVTYHALAAQRHGEHTPFSGIVLADTFQMTEAGDTLDNEVFTTNNDRATAQLDLPIRVIIGNPPYSVGQTSGNDDNANLKYPTLDGRIEETYAARSTATNKNSLYDSYVRAIRWASDRIGDRGIVAYVSNGGYIDGNTADGLRQTLVAEFSAIYVYNLRGNQRTAGELSRREGGKVFGSGSRSTVA
ncbi:MAG: DEAD/DEAH box helicase family protein, partial [Bifidobacteriaceae bacterium]|nr:DEAD/DEAH box helicase family protein [Bifidobacteriaceae bacterium]